MSISGKDDAGVPREIRTDDRGTVKVIEQNPVPKYRNTVDLNPSADNSLAVGAAAVEYPLPEPGGRYILIAEGGMVWIRENTAAVMHAVGGVCPDGVPIGPVRIRGPYLSAIAAAAGRTLYVIQVLD